MTNNWLHAVQTETFVNGIIERMLVLQIIDHLFLFDYFINIVMSDAQVQVN